MITSVPMAPTILVESKRSKGMGDASRCTNLFNRRRANICRRSPMPAVARPKRLLTAEATVYRATSVKG